MIPVPERRGWSGRFGAISFLVAIAAMLALPLAGHLFGEPAAQSDNRRLAAAPDFPTSWSAVIEWPRQADAYLGDHFGFRQQLVRAAASFEWNVLGASTAPSIVRGRNGRLFLADGDVPFRVLLATCGAWWPEPSLATFTRELAEALPRLQHVVPGALVLVVPTSTILYPQDLPGWVERACAGRVPLVDTILNRLPAPLREMISYPRDIAASLPASEPLIPLRSFHWQGAGVHTFLDRFAERTLHHPRQFAPSLAEETLESDLAIYVPGVDLWNRVRMAEWPGLEIRACQNGDCGETPPLDGITLPLDVLRRSRPGPGGRLLLITDSFGSAAAANFVGHFNDIIMINMNNFPRLSQEERRLLWERVTVTWQPDQVLMLIQDGNINQLPGYIHLIPGLPPR